MLWVQTGFHRHRSTHNARPIPELGWHHRGLNRQQWHPLIRLPGNSTPHHKHCWVKQPLILVHYLIHPGGPLLVAQLLHILDAG